MIDSYHARIIADFISENWRQFTDKMEELGETEAEAEEILKSMEKIAND